MEFDFSPTESLEQVPEQFRGLYAQGEDGKYAINEDFKGVAEAVTGLNKSLKAARAEAKNKTTVDLSPLQDFGSTPEEIKQAVDSKIEEFQNELAKGKDAKLNLDKVKQDLTAAHQNELEKRQKREEALQGQLYTLIVRNEAMSAISEAKGVPELLMPFIENQVKVAEENGKQIAYVVDQQGDQRYSGVTGQPMTIKELVSEMKANEKYGRLFESETPTGSGTPPGGPSNRPANKGKDMTANEKIAAGLNKQQAARK